MNSRKCMMLCGVFTCFSLMTTAAADRPAVVLPKDSLPKKIDVQAVRTRLKNAGVLPKDNELSDRRVELGRQLFFDPILSKDRTVSCASCHQPEYGFASPDAKAIGIRGQVGKRNSPTLLNRAFGKSQFWDGRARRLEEQALKPIANSIELGHSVDGVIADLRSDQAYLDLFKAAFGPPTSTQPSTFFVTAENLAKALASFQRTLLSDDSPVDRFQAGEYDALTNKERQGLWIFESRGRCWKCHSGNNYTDEAFHNTGIGFGDSNRDLGRFDVTKEPQDLARFKTPTLRAINLTAPYMHDGSLKTLEEVVEFYNDGGDSGDPNLDPEMRPLGLSSEEESQLVEFLRALSR